MLVFVLSVSDVIMLKKRNAKILRMSLKHNDEVPEVLQSLFHVMIGIVNMFLHCIDRYRELFGNFFLRLTFQAGGINPSACVGQFFEYSVKRLIYFGFYNFMCSLLFLLLFFQVVWVFTRIFFNYGIVL